MENNKEGFFFKFFSGVVYNSLQNLTLLESGKHAMAFTHQQHFTLTTANWRALVSIPAKQRKNPNNCSLVWCNSSTASIISFALIT